MDSDKLGELKNCPVCGRILPKEPSQGRNYVFHINCESCGEYEVTQILLEEDFQSKDDQFDLPHLSSFLCYHRAEKRTRIIGASNSHEGFLCVKSDEVEAWYPQTFADKIDLILDFLGENSSHLGDFLVFDLQTLQQVFFIEDSKETRKDSLRKVIVLEQFLFWFKYLLAEGLIEEPNHSQSIISEIYSKMTTSSLPLEGILTQVKTLFILTPKAWNQIYALQKSNLKNKDVFVSMSFDSKNDKTREAIKKGIIKAGFSPKFIDEIIHNKQIVPEMFRLIRECRFLILEISDPNYGAYYEAGYALGRGKEVIVCCSEEMFNKKYLTDEEKKFEKYLRPHFDIAQKQILIWKDFEDLTIKLSKWIKALIQ